MQDQSLDQESELFLEGVSKSFAGVVAVEQVDLAVHPSEFVTLLGPSGSGKTTVLRMIGGFIAPDSGRILVDGRDVRDVPVERRPTAMLFQQLSLWPHLTVARNVSFGLELRRMSKTDIARRVGELLDVVGLSDFGARLPSQLSGGQQQRVALARALALEPRILLLDEPFSALDTKLRGELRTFVRSVQRELGTTTLLVTHDQEEALELSDRIVVMKDGRVEQVGSPAEVYDSPGTPFVAEFLSAMNFFVASVSSSGVVLEGGPVVPVADFPAQCRQSGMIGVRPEDVLISDAGGRSVFVVEAVVPKGPYRQVTLRWSGGSLTSYVVKDAAPLLGDRVAVSFRHIHLFAERPIDSASGAADRGVAEARFSPRSSPTRETILLSQGGKE